MENKKPTRRVTIGTCHPVTVEVLVRKGEDTWEIVEILRVDASPSIRSLGEHMTDADNREMDRRAEAATDEP